MAGNETAIEHEDVIDDEDIIDDEETKSLGLVWRILIGLGAIVVVGILGYPFVNGFFSNSSNVEPTVQPEVQATVAGPAATALANPASASAQFELANTYYEAGQWELAADTYQKTIEIDPNFQAAYANLGATYYQLLNFDLAAAQYEKALELDAQDGESAYNLGAIYLQQALSQEGRPDEELLEKAVAQIQKALQLSPGLAEPYFSLGVAYLASDKKPEAIEAFETFLSLDTSQNSRARQDAEGYLEFLRQQ